MMNIGYAIWYQHQYYAQQDERLTYVAIPPTSGFIINLVIKSSWDRLTIEYKSRMVFIANEAISIVLTSTEIHACIIPDVLVKVQLMNGMRYLMPMRLSNRRSQ